MIAKYNLKSKFLPFCIIIILLFTISCEEVINIELKSSTPIMMVEGLIEQDSTGWVKLTYTSDYFSNLESEYVENASVKLEDDTGNSEIYTYQGNGLYKGNLIKGEAKREYILNISGPKFNIFASATLFAPSEIYSLNFEVLDLQPPGEMKELYAATLKFHDDPFSENFYMIKFWRNGTLDNSSYTLLRDSYYSKGDTIEYSSWRNSFEQGDKVIAGLYSIDQNTFAYYSQLNDILETGMGGSSTPYNPKSNFGPTVMGHFGAYSRTSAASEVK